MILFLLVLSEIALVPAPLPVPFTINKNDLIECVWIQENNNTIQFFKDNTFVAVYPREVVQVGIYGYRIYGNYKIDNLKIVLISRSFEYFDTKTLETTGLRFYNDDEVRHTAIYHLTDKTKITLSGLYDSGIAFTWRKVILDNK